MKFIESNPYRVIGLLSNTSEKDIQKQKSKITRLVSIGKNVESDIDFPFLGGIDRSEKSINKAFSAIEQNQERVRHSLFWFLATNESDKSAIKYLSTGKNKEAVEIWKKEINEAELTTKNFSCALNISTIYLLSKKKEEIKKGVEIKFSIINSEKYIEFIEQVADNTYKEDSKKQSLKLADDLIEQFQDNYSSKEILFFFNDCISDIKGYISSKLAQFNIEKVESIIEHTSRLGKEKTVNLLDLGLKLYQDTIPEMLILKSFLGKTDLKYTILADKLAKKFMRCSVDYSYENNIDQIELGLKLLFHAKAICAGKAVLDEIKKNIELLEQLKNSETKLIITILEDIKNSIQDIERKNREFSFFIPTLNPRQKEYSVDVNKLESILLLEITDEKIQKLLFSKRKSDINEFIRLLKFIRGEVKSNSIERIVDYLCNNLPIEHPFALKEKLKKEKLLKAREERERINQEYRRQQKRITDDKRKTDEEANRKRYEIAQLEKVMDQKLVRFLGVLSLIICFVVLIVNFINGHGVVISLFLGALVGVVFWFLTVFFVRIIKNPINSANL